ncbi:hypothetical protein V7201_15315 [Bacillus sp. JJ1122]
MRNDAQPVTKKEFEDFKQTIVNLIPSNSQLTHINEILNLINKKYQVESQEGIFEEVKNNEHKIPVPKHLQ